MIETTCPQCGKRFKYPASDTNRRFCSKSCARTALNLTSQNPAYTRDISGDKNPMYGKGLKGRKNPMFGKRRELSPRWKGGRKLRQDGYIIAVAPDDHPYPAAVVRGVKYVMEHRLVMERHLGRYLLPNEVVHHIDHNPANNAIENLRLFSSHSEHLRKEAHPRQKATSPRHE